jgi:hypothetical protein
MECSPLPVCRQCRVLADDELFQLSVAHPASFDNRYFGPIERSAVLGVAHAVVDMERAMNLPSRKHADVPQRIVEFKFRPSPTTSSRLRRNCTARCADAVQPRAPAVLPNRSRACAWLHTNVPNVRRAPSGCPGAGAAQPVRVLAGMEIAGRDGDADRGRVLR